jgi:hypothetical protein
MPILKSRQRSVGGRPEHGRLRKRQPRTASAACKLDTPPRLIAPAHSLTLPSLEGVTHDFQFSSGLETALKPVQALIEMGVVSERHVRAATSPVEALEFALSDMVNKHFSGPQDEFDVVLTIADRLEGQRPQENALFFVWSNSIDPQYIPLRPIYDKLDGNPRREALMASLYQWLYRAASRVFDVFGFDEAKNVYQCRKEYYKEVAENGEDVDLEGEVEYADPGKVVGYIRESENLELRGEQAKRAVASIAGETLRVAFEKARRMSVSSQKIKLPVMSRECAAVVDDAAYYMEASPMPGLGISHWRDDPIVAWFDQYCQEQFESGMTCRAPIILCFRPGDIKSFAQIVRALPKLVQIVSGLSEWVRFAREMENACDYGNR